MVAGSGWVLDTSALVWFAQGRQYAYALVWEAMDHATTLVVPTSAIVVAKTVTPPDTHHVIDVLLNLPIIVRDEVDLSRADDIAQVLCSGPAHPGEEHELQTLAAFAAAHVVAVARLPGWAVISDNLATLHAFAGAAVEIKQLRETF
ncbi:hypothetical protein [Nocardia sp. NRRL S-836]|uniref:hypothetical protein n=1 Tax=Nocardia sp. NRRL S-836 TaxID=1519492 RepID=UPI0006ADCFC8|nr:hypothetical protein [Nocardia sp. NRRL S-836]KOV84686.1 hypothetical protein ADL03_15535 [Nocardia sp. NRRL S-836]